MPCSALSPCRNSFTAVPSLQVSASLKRCPGRTQHRVEECRGPDPTSAFQESLEAGQNMKDEVVSVFQKVHREIGLAHRAGGVQRRGVRTR